MKKEEIIVKIAIITIFSISIFWVITCAINIIKLIKGL